MRVVKLIETGEIRSYLTSSEEQTDGEGNKFIEGLSSDRQVEDVTLEGQDLENLIDKYIRPTRDQLLKDSDAKWIEKSSKGEDLTTLNAYKQALRDFPSALDLSEVEYVDEIQFPSLGE